MDDKRLGIDDHSDDLIETDADDSDTDGTNVDGTEPDKTGDIAEKKQVKDMVSKFRSALLDNAIRSSKRITEKYTRTAKSAVKLDEFCEKGFLAAHKTFIGQNRPLIETLVDLSEKKVLAKDTPICRWPLELNKAIKAKGVEIIESPERVAEVLESFISLIEVRVDETIAFLES